VWGRALRLASAALLSATLGVALLAPVAAHADGDPGSDELLAQNLFTGDLNLSAKQQLALGHLLDATAQAHAPVRVAVISAADDLGTITPLWLKPQSYADYLGYELSLAYTGRLLIVMPNGYGVYWRANPAGAAQLAKTLTALSPPSSGTPAGYYAATIAVVDRIEESAGVEKAVLARYESGNGASSAAGTSADSSTPAAASTTKGSAAGSKTNGSAGTSTTKSTTAVPRPGHKLPSGLFLVVIVALLLLYVGWRTGRLGKLRPRRPRIPRGLRLSPIALLPTALLAVVVGALVVNQTRSGVSISPTSQKLALATNPHIDPGTLLTPARPAPSIRLTDQTGQTVSLSQYRGKVVILAFVDAECQTICPLTTTAMLDAQAALGKDAHQVQLLGVNANWRSTQIDDVLNYTRLHGMLGHWNFLTGSVPRLTRIWKDYGVNEKAFGSNEINHVAALFLIDPEGRLRESFTTYPSYSSVPQVGQLLAQDASALLPDHPKVLDRYSYAEAAQTPPTAVRSIPKLGGGAVELGPGKARLYLFFATWDSQTTAIAADLDELNTYSQAAGRAGLPPITAIDEGSVEPSARALPNFIQSLPAPLRYPVAIDRTGGVADGYQVEGEPWFVLVNAAGKIVWYQEVYTEGWPTLAKLERQVRASLSSGGSQAPAARQVTAELAGSPAPLAALHAQGSKLLPGGQSALDARIDALRRAGYSVVLNVWGSWCGPCQKEFGILATASEQYGKRLAFIGADTDDSGADAQAFLNEHHVSYPSYATTDTSIDKILVGGLQQTPTTVFIDPEGTVVYVQDGEYTSVGALDADIQTYSLGVGK
jgi:cytochrome oxidase Cu insertion factor (SCO1/SenC/PrrC family)/thiol-disulfide isomerase/thioredoxin